LVPVGLYQLPVWVNETREIGWRINLLGFLLMEIGIYCASFLNAVFQVFKSFLFFIAKKRNKKG